ncbi:salicylate hydroxylase [Penicillium angulare]|uniref:salicylate hydroxylase n=1 Tax=Penicillium angulare TaxID=116970 RepID=UPI0025420F22|nr:salicylate hydroxylase [Penicillium angulare]KAJ5273175.1 salicylate hydroxylase [Penicillium angulare]
MPLKVIIIGAGIAGLTAAVSLRRSGHFVEVCHPFFVTKPILTILKVLERSAFAGEVGAAINLAPNGTATLMGLGFDIERARGVPVKNWDTVHGTNLNRIACQDLSTSVERFGAPFLSVHRVDLHDELLRLAQEGPGGATLQLSSSVLEVNPDEGSVKLADGSVKYADLIVAADGLHSVARPAVASLASPKDTKLSAFRFLLPTEKIREHPVGRELLSWKVPGALLLGDPGSVTQEEERHLMWYSCRGLAEDVKCWPLFETSPLSKWTTGKLVLIGDAAHPVGIVASDVLHCVAETDQSEQMLPFGGQGSNQAIEDGGALGLLLAGVDEPSEIPHRLELFERLRMRRATRVQILSSVRANREAMVKERVQEFMEEGVTCESNLGSRA